VEDPELEKIARDYIRAEAAMERLRPALYARIYEFKQRWQGERGWQAWLVERTGLTRERLRQIVAAEERRRAGEDRAT
jgi:ribosomal protein L13E